jgi:hypothetical protein
MKAFRGLLIVLCFAVTAGAQQADSGSRIKELERKLDEATRHLEQATGIIQSLRTEVARLRTDEPRQSSSAAASLESKRPDTNKADQSSRGESSSFDVRIIAPDLGRDERESGFSAKPEVFIQARYAVAPLKDAGGEFDPNISLTRIETRWAGKLSERLGAGLEIQFHAALDGSPEELVNDAFIESYLNKHLTLRAGQFVKPFGFHIQQSSAARESPERAMFAGYFFPGQRDRGVMVLGDLDFLGSAFKGTQYALGAFNGNRFFTDNNRQMNYAGRLRKVFDRPRLAVGVSAQIGKQILPPGLSGNNDENVFGLDLQYAIGRFGLRSELAAGNMPSTLLSLDPQFAPAFRPGAHSTGGYLFTGFEVTSVDTVYARYDQFNGDPVTGRNVRAFNFGYVRNIGDLSRLGFDYQFKNRASFNDDAVNGRLHITWGIEF